MNMMKKILSCLLIVSLFVACSSEKEGNMTVNVSITGLKKGTVYLSKFQDTAIVNVDSVLLNGKSEFVLKDDVVSPEMYYITLDKLSQEGIAFFAEPGIINVASKLEKFTLAAEVTGSKNHEFLEEHKKMADQFNGKQLDFMKERFEAQKAGDATLMEDIDKREENLIKRKYLFTTNYAVNHSDYEVAPYLALTELVYATTSILDTVNNSLSDKIKASKYGVELDKYIKRIKENEEK
jgi:hypothetical protein